MISIPTTHEWVVMRNVDKYGHSCSFQAHGRIAFLRVHDARWGSMTYFCLFDGMGWKVDKPQCNHFSFVMICNVSDGGSSDSLYAGERII